MKTAFGGIVFALLMATQAGAQQEQPAPGREREERPWTEQLLGMPVHGYSSMKYRLRAGGGDSDQDLYEYLSLDVGDATQHPVTGHVFLRVSEDIDGDSGAFADITDTYTSNINERLYYGYVDVHRLGPVEAVRLGRQFQYETPVSLYFDGVTALTKECRGFQRARLGVYGGVPVHLFESPVAGDSIVGGWIQSDLWPGARGRVDYSRVRDSLLFGTATNDLSALGLWQALGARLQLQYQHTFLDGQNRDLLARAIFHDPELDLRVQASFYYLVETQRLESTDLDFFVSSAGEYFPYGQWRFLLSKGIGRHAMLSAGFDARELADEGDEAPFNREFRRYFLTPSVRDWPVPGLAASVTAEVWDRPGGSASDLITFGLEASYPVVEKLKVSAGTEYALYKFDALLVQERERVQTYFARAKYAVNKGLRLEASIEIEDGQADDFTTMRLGASQDF